MQINGIIAEYNPFHQGHFYQLTDARQATNADFTIVAMSGNFVQRGTPALLNKYKRAEMALKNGADLILELPMYYATSSAEYFARGAVSLLDKLGVVNNLCFGSECGDVTILQQIAKILVEEPEKYAHVLRQNLKRGVSYPTARTLALLEYEPAFQEYQELLSSPNNILGVEYLKALLRRQSNIKPYTTIRRGAGYNDASLGNSQDAGHDHISCSKIQAADCKDASIGETQCSALAIRQALFSVEPPAGNSEGIIEALRNHMPESAHAILLDCLSENAIIQSNDFSAILHYKLLSEQENGYVKYLDVSPELSDRICKNLYHFKSFTDFCDLLKTKDMTYTRISRCLLHILLGITSEIMDKYRAMDDIPYARVLGFRKNATPLLSAIKEYSSIPLVTKLADAEQTLDTDAWDMLNRDICMNRVYESILAQKSGQSMLNEYRTPIVIL